MVQLEDKMREEMMRSLREDLADVLNKHSAENGSDTPDFILGLYLTKCLNAFDEAVDEREKWYGRNKGGK